MNSSSKKASDLFGNLSANDFKAVKVRIKRANMSNPHDLILPDHIERDIVDPRDIVPLVNAKRGFNKGQSIFDRSDVIVNQTFDEPPHIINPSKQSQPGNATSHSSEQILPRSSGQSRSRYHRHSPRRRSSCRSKSPDRREPTPRRIRHDSARRSRSRRSGSHRRSREKRRSRDSPDRDRRILSRHSDCLCYYKRYSPTTSRSRYRHSSRESLSLRYRSRSPDAHYRTSTSRSSPNRERFIVKRLRSISKERRFVRRELYRPLRPGEYIPNHPDLLSVLSLFQPHATEVYNSERIRSGVKDRSTAIEADKTVVIEVAESGEKDSS